MAKNLDLKIKVDEKIHDKVIKFLKLFFSTMFLALFSGCTTLAITGGGLGLCVFKCRP